MSEDSRKLFILTSAANLFSKSPSDFHKYENDKHLERFLNDLNTLLLIVNYSKEITFTTKVLISQLNFSLFQQLIHYLASFYLTLQLDDVNKMKGRSLVFYKSSEDIITPDNIRSIVLVSSIVDSPIDSLFYLVHNFYTPVLQNQQKNREADTLDNKLTNTLADLETNLKSAIRRADSGSKSSSLTPLDEFQYWAEMSEKAKNKEARERAAFFYKEFERLVKYYKQIDTIPIIDIANVIEDTQDSYDYVWRQNEHEPPYSQERMTNLLEITSIMILIFNFKTFNLFIASYFKIVCLYL
jgi:hypothetical protein